ncbi:MAG: AAA family ATPase, partial [Synergistaceae bacterium]|nr:AAA family ATPase [Synergistaceae bacterium]
LIDLDPQNNLTFNFMTREDWENKYSKNKTMKNFFDTVVEGKETPSLRPLIIKKTFGDVRLDLITSHVDLISLDIRLSTLLGDSDEKTAAKNYMKTINCLSQALSTLEYQYDLVIIDCPVNFNFSVKSALYASDYYIAPTKLDALSSEGIYLLTRLIDSCHDECNEYINKLDNSSYKPLSLKMLGVVPMMAHVAKGKTLIEAENGFLQKLEGDYEIFPQFVRDNTSIFGAELKDKAGNVVPVVLAHLGLLGGLTKSSKATIISELQILCDQILGRMALPQISQK